MTALCFIDTETTGVHPGRQVWEVAMVRREDGQQQEISFFVDVDLSAADPFGLKVGRFYDRHPVGKWVSAHTGRWRQDRPKGGDIGVHLNRKTAAETIVRFTHGAHLVGAVPNFDAETLDPLLRDYGYLPGWHYHLIDVEALAVGWIAGRRRTWSAVNGEISQRPAAASLPWKSDDLSRAVGVEPPSDEERHTALGDARWAMRLYDAITGAGEAL